MSGSGGLARLLARHRRLRGLSQEALAARADVSVQAVSDIETGVTRIPRPATMAALSDALDLDEHQRAALIEAASPWAGPPVAVPDLHRVADESSYRPGDFVRLIVRLRQRAGLSRLALAQAAGLTDKALSNLEKGRTVRVRGATATALADALALDGQARRGFLAAAAGLPEASSGTPHETNTGAPPPSSRVHGRVKEYAHLLELVNTAPLVTVTGPGGVGKTALAGVVADADTGPVHRLMLASVPPGTPALLAMTSLLAPDESDLGSVLERIEPGALMLLDNLEHLRDRAQAIDAIRHARADLRLLATSRTALGLQDEQQVALGPLDLSAACAVFEDAAERAGAAPIGAADRAALEQICTRMDCLPLAIELAAARAPLMGIRDILHELDRPIRLLRRPSRDAGDRHAAISMTVDWSLRLLPMDAARLLLTLSTHPAPWPLPLIMQVHDTPDVLDSLHELSAAHLVKIEVAGATRCWSLLQLVADVAREHLGDKTSRAGTGSSLEPRLALPVDAARIRQRHAAASVRLAVEDAKALLGADQARALEAFDALSPHHDAALAHLTGVGDPEALTLAAAFWRYWQLRGRFRLGRAAIEAAIAATPAVLPALGEPSDPVSGRAASRSQVAVPGRRTRQWTALAAAHYGAGVLAHLAGDNDVARSHARTSLRLYEQLNDKHGTGSLLSLIGMIELHTGHPRAALKTYRRGLREVTWQAAPRAHATLLSNIGPVHAALGDLNAAIAAAEQAAIRYRSLNDPHSTALQLGNLAGWSAELGDTERARDLLNESVATFEALGDDAAAALAHLGIAEFALDDGRADQARQALDLAQARLGVDDRWSAAHADALRSELSLLDGDSRRAVPLAAVARQDGEVLGYRVASVRAILVLAAASTAIGDPTALTLCRDGLAACEDGDVRAIVSFAALVDRLLGADSTDPQAPGQEDQSPAVSEGRTPPAPPVLVVRPAAIVAQAVRAAGGSEPLRSLHADRPMSAATLRSSLFAAILNALG